MDELIKLVRTFRFAATLPERVKLAEDIFSQIEPDLRFFVFGALRLPAAEDVLQEILKGIATGLTKFKGDTKEQFWAWCYTIARNKLNDHFRKQAADRLQPMPQEEFWDLVEASEDNSLLSAGDRHDLDYAMDLLTAAKPECFEFLRQHYIFGKTYGEIAEEGDLNYDAVRMKIGRCLDEAQSLVS